MQDGEEKPDHSVTHALHMTTQKGILSSSLSQLVSEMTFSVKSGRSILLGQSVFICCTNGVLIPRSNSVFTNSVKLQYTTTNSYFFVTKLTFFTCFTQNHNTNEHISAEKESNMFIPSCITMSQLTDPSMKAITLLQRTEHLIYGMLFYVIIYASDKLAEIIRFLAHSVCTHYVTHICRSIRQTNYHKI